MRRYLNFLLVLVVILLALMVVMGLLWSVFFVMDMLFGHPLGFSIALILLLIAALCPLAWHIANLKTEKP